jgi:hypothetical protein
MSYFVVLRQNGPEWDPSVGMREQREWDEHAEFMDALVADGFVVLGGPLADGRVVLAVSAESEDVIRATLARDPWSESLLRVESIDRWTILLDGR